MFLDRGMKVRLRGVPGWFELVRPMPVPQYWLAYDFRQEDMVLIHADPSRVTVRGQTATRQK
jgi:hypothetical protein